MQSHFMQEEELLLVELPEPVWWGVFRSLEDPALVSARAVSRRFRELADVLLHQRFLERWGAAALVGSPPPAPALASAQLQHFAWRHQVGAGDTLARIAVKYGTTTASVKRLNNLMTDHSLATRDAVYIAVGSAQDIQARQVAFAYCKHAKRRYMVVLREGEEPPPELAHAPHGRQRAVEQLTLMLQQGLRIDECTAAFYMAQAQGNLRAAIAAYEDDKRWERVMRPLRGRRL